MMTLFGWLLMIAAYTTVGVVAARIVFVTGFGSKKKGSNDRSPARFFGTFWPLLITVVIILEITLLVAKLFDWIGKFVYAETPKEKEARLDNSFKDATELAIMMLAETDPELLSDDETELVRRQRFKNAIVAEQYRHGRSIREISRRRDTEREWQ